MDNLFDILKQRGFVAQVTDESLGRILAEQPVSLYAGFDPTADSLHVGHLLPVMAMAHFQQQGHRPLVVVGGATGMVGDPSGRSEERNLLTPDQVAANARAIRNQLSRFLRFEGEAAAVMLDNHDWIGPLSFIDWLRDVGKYFSIGYMVGKDSVRSRMNSERGISFTEFSYMTMQAYDFLHLFDTHNCTLQIGGNDQWGNITAGMDLIHKARGASVFGLTVPLITTASGQKFGKSEGNAVWLDADRTSEYQFYQYWMNTEDADVERFLKFFSFMPVEQIQQICADHAAAPERRLGQQSLAAEMTRLVHGDAGLAKAQAASQAMFGGELDALDEADLLDIFADVPGSQIQRSRIEAGVGLLDLLAESGLCQSKGEARRMIRQGAIYLNNQRISDEAMTVSTGQLLTESVLVLRSGKKRYHLVRVV